MAPRLLLDTRCMVPAVCAWHRHYRSTISEIDRRLDSGEAMLLAAPALIEADSVLTRLPAPFRLSPAHALQLLEAKLLSYAAEVVTLGAAACRQLLSEAARQNTAGGRVDNAVVVACGLAAKADVVLTCYERQFVPLTGPEIAIVVPA